MLLLQIERPSRREISKAMVKAGIFKAKEIKFALLEIFNTIYGSAERRFEEALAELRKEGYKIVIADDKTIRCLKENSCV